MNIDTINFGRNIDAHKYIYSEGEKTPDKISQWKMSVISSDFKVVRISSHPLHSLMKEVDGIVGRGL